MRATRLHAADRHILTDPELVHTFLVETPDIMRERWQRAEYLERSLWRRRVGRGKTPPPREGG